MLPVTTPMKPQKSKLKSPSYAPMHWRRKLPPKIAVRVSGIKRRMEAIQRIHAALASELNVLLRMATHQDYPQTGEGPHGQTA
jgi:hypothetical protein